MISGPIYFLLALSGWVVYRYRATRAFTMAQFFEMRYSRKFRIYAGILAWVSGIINFGIFPSVGARFFINFCGFENYLVTVLGVEVNLTLGAVMLVLLSLSLYFTFVGGQVSILVTDFTQGMFSKVIFLALIITVMVQFPWSTLREALLLVSEPGRSLVNPLDLGEADFDVVYWMIAWFFAAYQMLSWQGSQAYNCSATTAHEAKMAGLLGGVGGPILTITIIWISVAALAIMNLPEYADQAAVVTERLNEAYGDDQTLKTQMLVPAAMRTFIPVGLFGAFAAAMLGFFITTHNTYMHSWGSIFIQDIVCVLRRTPLTGQQHMRALRASVIFVAVFIFFFSLLFPLAEYIAMFFAITGAIYLGGSGAVIIGGLYWKRGTTAAAFTTMTVGAITALGVIVLRTVWEDVPFLVETFSSAQMPWNSQIVAFWLSIVAILVYVVVSLLTPKPSVDFDRLFHRGKYAIKVEQEEIERRVAHTREGTWFWRLLGAAGHEFSRFDRFIVLYNASMVTFSVSAFFVLLGLNWERYMPWLGDIPLLGSWLVASGIGLMSDESWANWWQFWCYLGIVLGLIGFVWITTGGLLNFRSFYRRLDALDRNEHDDGRVSGDHLLADEDAGGDRESESDRARDGAVESTPGDGARD